MKEMTKLAVLGLLLGAGCKAPQCEVKPDFPITASHTLYMKHACRNAADAGACYCEGVALANEKFRSVRNVSSSTALYAWMHACGTQMTRYAKGVSEKEK